MLSLLAKLWPKPSPPALFDSAFGSALGSEARRYLEAGEFVALEATLQRITEINELDACLRKLADWDGRAKAIELWNQALPDSFFAKLADGLQLTKWAWEARSARCAEYVGEEAFQIFFERLAQAENVLQTAARMDPEHALPFAFQITVAKGLQRLPAQQSALFERTISRAANLQVAYLDYLSCICQKWGGSHKAMFDFALTHSKHLNELRLLLAAAHIEFSITLSDSYARATHFARDQNREQLCQAFDDFLRVSDPILRRRGANWFALALVFAQQPGRARMAFERTENFAAEIPWVYFGDANKAFLQNRRAVR